MNKHQIYKTAITIKIRLRGYKKQGGVKTPYSNNKLDKKEVFEWSKVIVLFRSKVGILVKFRFYEVK